MAEQKNQTPGPEAKPTAPEAKPAAAEAKPTAPEAKPAIRKIIMLRTCAGAGWKHEAGETVSVPADRARTLIALGNAKGA